MDVDFNKENSSDSGYNKATRRSSRFKRQILSDTTSNSFYDDDEDMDVSDDDFQTDGDSSYCGSLNDSDDCSSDSDYERVNKLSLMKQVQVIKCHDRRNSVRKLAKIFKCDKRQINNIITNRFAILKTFEENNLEATTKEPAGNDQQGYNKNVRIPTNKVAKICRNQFSRQYEIKNDLQSVNARSLTDINSKKSSPHKLRLEQCVMVIKFNDRKFSYQKLASIYNCSVMLIASIIKNRDTIMTLFKKLKLKGLLKDNNDAKENTDQLIKGKIEGAAKQTQQQLDVMDCHQTIRDKSDDDADANNDKLQNNFPAQQQKCNHDVHNNVIIDCDLLDSDDGAGDILKDLNENTNPVRIETKIEGNIKHTQHFEEMDCFETIIVDSDDEDNNKTDNLSPSGREKLQIGIPSQQNLNNNTHNKVLKGCNLLESDESAQNSVNEETNNKSNFFKTKQINNFNKLRLEQCVMVIKCHDRKFPNEKLASIFNCSAMLIDSIIKSRDTILNLFKKVKRKDLVVYKGLNESAKQTTIKTEIKQPEELDCNSTIIVLSDEDDADIITPSNSKKPENDLTAKQNPNHNMHNNVIIDCDNDIFVKASDDFNKSHLNRPKESEKSDRYAGNADLSEKFKSQQQHHPKNIDSVVENSQQPDSNDDSNDSTTSNQSKSCSRLNNLTLGKSVKLIKAFDDKVPFKKLAPVFKCSFIQFRNVIENRDAIIKAFKEINHDDRPLANDGRIEKPKMLKRRTPDKPKKYLSLYERIAIIEDVDRLKGRNEICRKFKCARNQILSILKKRDELFSLYEESLKDESSPGSLNEIPNSKNGVYLRKKGNTMRCNRLNLDERIGVIKAQSLNMTAHKLACIFNCSEGQITNILLKRKAIIEEYKNLHPDLYENDKELQLLLTSNRNSKRGRYNINKLPLHKRVEVIRAYEQDPNIAKLGRWFECSPRQIKEIVLNREGILRVHNDNNE